MSEDNVAISYRKGEMLIWMVRRNTLESADAIALCLGDLADAHGLGEWEITPIGLADGERCWFDLTLSKDIGPVLLKLIFARLPCHVY